MSRYYYQNPESPTPERLHLGVAVAIFRDGRIWLDHRRDGGWGLFGGAMELGESLLDCARREVREETGLDVDRLRLLGHFSHRSRIIAFGDGQVVQSVTVCFATDVMSDRLQLSAESREARLFEQHELQTLPIVETHRMIVPYLFRPEAWPVLA